MLYNRTRSKLYVLYLIPHKNQLIINTIKKCPLNINRFNHMIGSLIIHRGFRTRIEHSTGLTGNKRSNNDDGYGKKFTILKLFNQPSYLDELRKKMVDSSIKSSNGTDKDKINNEDLKLAFAEGYLAGSSKLKKKSFLDYVFKLIGGVIIVSVLYRLLTSNVGRIKVLMGNDYEIKPEEIEVTFNDAHGIDEAKEELQDIVEFLRDPEKFTKLGAHLPKGVLLVGSPGTGKTLLAKAIAGEAGVPFFHASGSEFDEILVGQGARRIRDLFEAAKSKSPCVIFIDEIDSVGGKRSNSMLHPYANQTINQLLSEMDGFRSNEGVIVLGATNRRSALDSALLRPGRFDIEVRVPKPDLTGRKQILNYYINKIKLGEEIDLDLLSKQTLGFSGAEIENMVNQAALRAALNDDDGVTMKHLDDALDKVRMGPEKKTKIPDSEVNRLTAYHEAGHTLVAYYSKHASPVHKVTIIPRGDSLGHTAYVPEKDYVNHTKLKMLAALDSAMGGRVAEELIFGEDNITVGSANDLERATQLARNMVKNFGYSDKVGLAVYVNEAEMYNQFSNTTLETIEQEVKRLLNESYERAKQTLKAHKKELDLLAEALLKYETLDLEQIKKVIEGQPLNNDQ